MKCYVLEPGQSFYVDAPKAEVSARLEQKILELCQSWQARDLHQEGPNPDDYHGETLYEALNPENFVVSMGIVAGYYAVHFHCARYVSFSLVTTKYHVGDYDFTDYSNSDRVNRGFVAIVPKPDRDTNPYHDEPRFHSQEEYDDHIKWRD